jgi:uncharacterized Zn finger protein
MSWYSFRPYVSVAQRRANAKKEMAKLMKKGQTIAPIAIEGRKIAKTFWGKAWCDHIEGLADFDSRLPRGRTYVRNGSVCHLQIAKGRIDAHVCGSELYTVGVDIEPLSKKRWLEIKQSCAGQIGTALELLQGKFSDAVMRVLTDPQRGMFPSSDDFDLDCSCPDYVRLCKHLAAVLYGVGARLDTQPELLFTLRGVNPTELVAASIDAGALTKGKSAAPTLADSELADVFGIDIDMPAPMPSTAPVKAKGAKPMKVPGSNRTMSLPNKTSRKTTKKPVKTAQRKASKKAMGK